MSFYKNPDLHSHSTCSDGTLSPEAVAERARARGVDLWSLTDHDGVDGQPRARAAAAALGMDYVCGVEISVTWSGTTIHVVGLGFDAGHTDLIAGLKQIQNKRIPRARAIADKLRGLGIEGSYQGALALAGEEKAIARPHFARHLVETGICEDTRQAFDRYLRDGGPAFVPQRWASLKQALDWIGAADGLAVLAHPARYRLNAMEEAQLLREFQEQGGQAIEVATGSHSASEIRRYTRVALEHGFAASRGSDFHGPAESHTDLGGMPKLPDGLTPVWDLLGHRILAHSL